MTRWSRLSLAPVFALGAIMLLAGCSSYTTGYYPGRHSGDGVRQPYTNDEGNNVGYTINPRNTGSRVDPAQTPRSAPGSTAYYSRAPLARGGYSYSPGVYTASVNDSSYGYVAISTYGRRGSRHFPGQYGFGRGGYESYSYGGGYHSGFGFGYQSGYHGGSYGGHYGGHYSGHGSHGGHSGHGSHGGGHGSHSGGSHHGGGSRGTPVPTP